MSAAQTRDLHVHRAAVALLLVVALGALALSFTGLALLGTLAGFAGLAPVFAVVVDAGTGAATLYWLTGAPTSRRPRYARRLGVTLLAVSLVGNAGAHGLAAHGVPVEGLAAGLVLTMPWWAAAAVGATPPVIFAGVVHLLAMADEVPAPPATPALPPAGAVLGEPVGDGWETDGANVPDWWETAPPTAPSTPAEYAAARGLEPAPPLTSPAPVGERVAADAHPGDVPDEPQEIRPAVPDRAAALIAEGAGRRRLSRELDITEHAARELIAAHAARTGTTEGAR